MDRSEQDPDAFIATLPPEIGADMAALDRLITAALPGRRRRLWTGKFWGGTDQSIIGYGDIVQHRSTGEPVEWFVVGLARQKKYFSVYVNAAEDGQHLLARYAGRLGRVKTGASNISITKLADVDLDELGSLLRRANELADPDVAG